MLTPATQLYGRQRGGRDIDNVWVIANANAM